MMVPYLVTRIAVIIVVADIYDVPTGFNEV